MKTIKTSIVLFILSISLINVVAQQNDEEWRDNLYRNNKFKFRIEFPTTMVKDDRLNEKDAYNEWEYMKGAGKNVLAKAVNVKMAITISITVRPVELDNPPKHNDIWQELDEKDIEAPIRENMSKHNYTCTNFKVKKGALSNFNAYVTSYNIVVRSEDNENIDYFYKSFQCYVKGNMYNVSISSPSFFWENEELQKTFSSVVDSFQFEFF